MPISVAMYVLVLISIILVAPSLVHAQNLTTNTSELSKQAVTKYINSSLVEFPDAKSIYESENIKVPQSIGSFIILIPNEAHESWSDEKHKLITDHNWYYVPTNLIIPHGTSISFLDADAPWDTPHPHTIQIKDSSGNVVYNTGKMEYSDHSASKTLDVGNYSVIDTTYNWMNGKIVVTDQKSTGKDIVGAFYTPTKQVDNPKDNDGGSHPGWLGYYQTEFPKNGFNILSEHDFSYNKCSYCEGKYWPDNKTGNHTLIIFSTGQPLDEALLKLKNLVKDNVYI